MTRPKALSKAGGTSPEMDAVAEAMREITDPRLRAFTVASLVRALSGRVDRATVHRALREAEERGEIELQPDKVGPYLSEADARVCPSGPRGTVFSIARVLRAPAPAPLRRTPRGEQVSPETMRLLDKALMEAEAPRLGLVRIPEVVRRLAGRLAKEEVHQALLEAQRRGALELHPDAGSEFLRPEDASLCPPGPRGTVFSLGRRLRCACSTEAK